MEQWESRTKITAFEADWLIDSVFALLLPDDSLGNGHLHSLRGRAVGEHLQHLEDRHHWRWQGSVPAPVIALQDSCKKERNLIKINYNECCSMRDF